MTGPLGVTHLLMFSKSSTGNTNLRLALTPRGPTIHFRVENYSLCKDIAKALKHQRKSSKAHLTPPLLVMNNFVSSNPDESSKGVPKHLESLTTTVFQSLFPPISPQTTPLSSIRRIMLLNREMPSSSTSDDFIVSLRHYAITTKRTDVSRRIRRLDPKERSHKDRKEKPVPNLGKLDDVADYLLDPAAGGYTSASETELDTDAEVEVADSTAKKILNKRDLQRMRAGEKKSSKESGSGVEKRAVKLVELGPRMRLKMMKVEEGLCGGRVMWHSLIAKSESESKKMDETWEKRRKEKELRKKQQKENIEKKRQEQAKDGQVHQGEAVEDGEEWLSEDFDNENEDESMSDAE